MTGETNTRRVRTRRGCPYRRGRAWVCRPGLPSLALDRCRPPAVFFVFRGTSAVSATRSTHSAQVAYARAGPLRGLLKRAAVSLVSLSLFSSTRAGIASESLATQPACACARSLLRDSLQSRLDRRPPHPAPIFLSCFFSSQVGAALRSGRLGADASQLAAGEPV